MPRDILSTIIAPMTTFSKPTATQTALGIAAMAAVVVASNILVQHAINDWLTWGALSYPFAFLVSELINRRFGPAPARRVAWVGFALAVLLSVYFADPRIAAASGLAFLASQLLDISVFDRLRHSHWWRAPLTATVLAAIVDTGLFFSIAFVGTDVPWVTLALGDLGVKLFMGLVLLLPFRLLMARFAPALAAPSAAAHGHF